MNLERGHEVTTRSQHGHNMVTTRSQQGHNMVTTRSQHGHNTVTTESLRLQNVPMIKQHAKLPDATRFECSVRHSQTPVKKPGKSLEKSSAVARLSRHFLVDAS